MAEPYKVVMVGAGGVGKSALTLQYMYGDFVTDYEPTKVAWYSKKLVLDGEEMKIDILDTAGQEGYAVLLDSYFRSGEGFLLVFSIAEADTFARIAELRELILRVKGTDQVPMVLVGNKADMESEREISQQQAQDLAKSFNIKYIECSAKTEEHVQEAFSTVFRMIHGSRKSVRITIEPQSPSKGKKCCSIC